MKTVAIIQARMTSSRLPGKILADIGGKPMLARQLDRLKRTRNIDTLVIATTTNSTDDAVVDLARSANVSVFRGDEHDVLSRYLGAAIQFGADIVVRVTADCPLIDPDVTDRVIARLQQTGADYASNIDPRTFPRGLDTEAFPIDVLQRVDRLASERPAREHVTLFINASRRDLFLRANVTNDTDESDLRWTVDVPEDLELIRRIFDLADLAERHVPFHELVRIVRAHPELIKLNAHVEQARTGS